MDIDLPDEVVVSKIYFIRDHKVMLDEDLAELFQLETRRLNEQVKGNADRFPHVSINRTRMEKLDVAKCDIKLGRA
jgi:hypothetical protein